MKLTYAMTLVMFFLTAAVFAENKNRDIKVSNVEQAVHKALPGTKITSVKASVITGLVEVVAGSNVLYADPKGQYLVIGNIYDMHTATDLTAKRQRNIQKTIRVKWSDLPLDSAIKYDGKGPTKLAVFFDPGCPWCKKLHEQLALLKDVEVYAILYPVKARHSRTHNKAADILCAENPLHALNTVMAGKALPAIDDATCLIRSRSALDRVDAFARRHSIHGTPTLIAGDGRVRAGFLAAKPLKAWLDAYNKNKGGKS